MVVIENYDYPTFGLMGLTFALPMGKILESERMKKERKLNKTIKCWKKRIS